MLGWYELSLLQSTLYNQLIVWLGAKNEQCRNDRNEYGNDDGYRHVVFNNRLFKTKYTEGLMIKYIQIVSDVFELNLVIR
jgi:hypothetical protein